MADHNINLFLVGMPGAGKSTIGRALAKQLNKEFIDSDEEIVRRCGVDVATIFEVEGEAGFRAREKSIIAELTLDTNIVLATGGGAILNCDTRELLRQRGVVIYLRADIDELVRRTSKQSRSGGNKRPLLQTGDIRERLTKLLDTRAPLYASAAHITLDVEAPNRNKTLQRLLTQLESYLSAADSHPQP
jgi:shikimate kinase / 3-dehydroquinate synthase